MSRFTGQLYLRSLSIDEVRFLKSAVQLYQVTGLFAYESDKLGRTVTVPVGLVTDFASIPRAAWDIISPADPIIEWPSVVHDYLYSRKGVLEDGFTYTREQADAVLREAMEVQGAHSIIRNLVYDAVQLGGGTHWNSKP